MIAAVAWTPDDLEVFERNADRQNDLSYWFGKEDRELDSPKIIETPQGKLLFDEYRQLDNGLVELKPRSMVFLSHDASGDEGCKRLRVPALDGALLRFDDDVSFKQAKIEPIGGELLGEVQISGGQRLPGTGRRSADHHSRRDAQRNGHLHAASAGVGSSAGIADAETRGLAVESTTSKGTASEELRHQDDDASRGCLVHLESRRRRLLGTSLERKP